MKVRKMFAPKVANETTLWQEKHMAYLIEGARTNWQRTLLPSFQKASDLWIYSQEDVR